MRSLRSLILILLCIASSVALSAQRQKRDALTPAQADKIREAGVFPAQRISLYTQYVDEHVDSIKALAGRAHTAAWAQHMDNELLDLTALMDELGSNLDEYSDRKADLRKSLKPLTKATQRWLSVLRALPTARTFDLARTDAIASAQDLVDDAAETLKEQEEYFNLHPDQGGQERAEPN
jgi:hypothetical protein